MLVKDFIALNQDGAMFEVVDANLRGYITCPSVLIMADRNVVSNMYGDKEIVGFSVKTKRTITIYAK